MWIPNKKSVVIATRCKLAIVVRPLEPTNLRFMPGKLANVIFLSTDIMVEDALVATSRRKQ